MIALLSCSMNSLGSDNDTIPPTGGVKKDSVLIAYDDLRIVNSKLVELKYEKEINKNLKEIISNDSVAITGIKNRIAINDEECNKDKKRLKTQRNILGGSSVLLFIALLISLL